MEMKEYLYPRLPTAPPIKIKGRGSDYKEKTKFKRF